MGLKDNLKGWVDSTLLAEQFDVDHQVVVDEALAVPPSMRDLVKFSGDESVLIHESLLPQLRLKGVSDVEFS